MSRLWTPKLSVLPMVTLRILTDSEKPIDMHTLQEALLSSPHVLSVSLLYLHALDQCADTH